MEKRKGIFNEPCTTDDGSYNSTWPGMILTKPLTSRFAKNPVAQRRKLRLKGS